MSKAQDCDNREQARKLIKKADKINNKLDGISSNWVRSSTSIAMTSTEELLGNSFHYSSQ